MNSRFQPLFQRALSWSLGAVITALLPSAALLAQTMPFSPAQAIAASPNKDALEISALLRAGRLDTAAARVDALLARNPKDAQARFLKGLVLTDQGKTDDALQAFRTLTEDYPELPEPYNNLAALYSVKGQFDNARIALESAVQANPSYVTAYENLGDLYTRMATQAYDRVLQIDKSNSALQAKVASIKNAMAAAAVKTPTPGPAAGTSAPSTPPPISPR